ncbi:MULTISPECIES: hydantoinase/oxoprolinase family protein [Microbacterium]|uniref:hydantoinase/oxoprolinase family protein n=1 Tax=Microbacterium TaxID=33882 RepID=UPI0027841271|nr:MULTISPECIES: hydantoinase/oxoprolinase family protein [Microbacterium]MDQ1084960.1 N-methylhydantoinase A/oxoprolinase/acetone carboxylase beta subunit [Microbacterium sp. SORGH_AS_0344]MDQ1169765.1 N-methylhydantoinase A/oxoprolinase/acetone carboxylase beta subunit [Microbacterium proteolyticum]
MHIGIDVGGTNTDAVLMDGKDTLAGVKKSTSPDVTTGIVDAIAALRAERDFAGSDIDAVMIGTTHFINALVQAQRLAPTAAVRLGLPATKALPPLVDWPGVLTEAIQARSYLAHGGYEFDGRPISPLDEDELRGIADDMKAHGVRSVAISSVFSPVNHDLEVRAAEILGDVLGPDVAISLSHEIGRIGLLERENATIINAALRELASEIVDGLTAAVRAEGIEAPIFLSQNDGTLMDEDYVRLYPVATFASGPTNSMRGAALTSGLQTCAVVDIGGTTADIGLLNAGFPRETANEVKVAGIRTNFRMPDVLSIGIGGGSIVDLDTGEVGPASVGYRLTEEALVFGGSTLTATDIAVAAGRANVGDPSRVAHLDPAFVERVLTRIADRVAEAVDRMRTSPEPIPVVAVGGGSILLPEELPMFGAVHRPRNYAVANAIGASIAQVGGEIDKVYAIEAGRRDEGIAAIRAEAVDKAVAAGARPSSVSIVDFDEVPIPYLPGNATRVRVKAVGDLDMGVRA